MSDIVLKDKNGVKNTFSGVETIKIANSEGSYNNYIAEPTGELIITENGTYDVSKYASVIVTIEKEPSFTSATVTINCGQDYGNGMIHYGGDYFVYDGVDENLYETSENGELYDGNNTITITSGYISIYAHSSVRDAIFESDLEIVYQNGNNIIYKVDRDDTISITCYPCLVEGTQISLADGTTKAVEDITMDDNLLVWDFYEGKKSSSKPMWILPKSKAVWYTEVTLSNGTVIKMVGPHGHRMYNMEKELFLYPSDFSEGEHTITLEGDLVTIRSIERIDETVSYYNIITDTHYNLYAEGILTSCRLSNRYGIVGMKYDTNDVRMTDEEVKAYIDRLPCKRSCEG